MAIGHGIKSVVSGYVVARLSAAVGISALIWSYRTGEDKDTGVLSGKKTAHAPYAFFAEYKQCRILQCLGHAEKHGP